MTQFPYETFIDIAQVTVGHAIDADDCPDFHRAPLRILREQLETLYGAAVSNRGGEVPERITNPFVVLPPLTKEECEDVAGVLDKALRTWKDELAGSPTPDEQRAVIRLNSLRTAFAEAAANHHNAVG